MIDVQGKTALVTGGAMGMGLIWARHFARDGANLVLWDLNGEGLERAAEELRGQVDVMTQVVDVSDRGQIYRSAVKVQAETGGVDILVNNAGIVFSKPFLETPDEQLSATIDVDLKALFWTMKAFLPRMLEENAGHIINISSASGFIGVPRMPAYVASKWGVIGLTESVRLEVRALHKDGVGFTLFCPSYVDTGMFEGAKAPLLTPMLRPETAVRIAYDGFREGRYMITAPWMVGLTPALKGLLPSKLFDLVGDLFGVTRSMEDWKDTRRNP
jgi:NAD(P)-dependent dehydrogenase (short-subunit alcohol dehydrogenase family)